MATIAPKKHERCPKEPQLLTLRYDLGDGRNHDYSLDHVILRARGGESDRQQHVQKHFSGTASAEGTTWEQQYRQGPKKRKKQSSSDSAGKAKQKKTTKKALQACDACDHEQEIAQLRAEVATLRHEKGELQEQLDVAQSTIAALLAALTRIDSLPPVESGHEAGQDVANVFQCLPGQGVSVPVPMSVSAPPQPVETTSHKHKAKRQKVETTTYEATSAFDPDDMAVLREHAAQLNVRGQLSQQAQAQEAALLQQLQVDQQQQLTAQVTVAPSLTQPDGQQEQTDNMNSGPVSCFPVPALTPEVWLQQQLSTPGSSLSNDEDLRSQLPHLGYDATSWGSPMFTLDQLNQMEASQGVSKSSFGMDNTSSATGFNLPLSPSLFDQHFCTDPDLQQVDAFFA